MDLVRRLVHGPERKRTHIERKRFLRLLWSYGIDWVVTIVLVGIIAYLTDKAGYKREFSLSDTSLQHTHATKERITFGECILYAGGIPAIFIVLIAIIWRRSFWDLHNGILGILLSVSLTTVFTQIIKICAGRPRPDIIDRCQPIVGAANKAVYGLAVAAEICTTDINSHIMLDGFRSFPSGHSSFAWSGLGFLALYLAGKMHLFDRRGHTVKAWIAIIPPVGATLIAVSRTMDYRHHATDVIAGSILGAVISFFTYHLYYPSLFSPHCHLPFSPRIPPSLPHDELTPSTDPTRPPHTHTSSGGILPVHRFSASMDSTSAIPSRDSNGEPISPNSQGIPLEASSSHDGLGETAPRPQGGAVGAGQGKSGYYQVTEGGY